MPKKLLFALTSHGELGNTGRKTGFYLPELTHPLDVIQAAGHDFDLVSTHGGEAPMDGVNRDDRLNAAFLDSPTMMQRVAQTLSPDQIRSIDYAAILFVGGHGTMWDFPDNEPLARIAADIHEAGGVVAAVCHGPAALVNLRLSDGSYLVAGREIAAFTNEEEAAVGLTDVVPFLLEDELSERGAIIRKAPPFEANVVVSERLVTGQNPASAKGVGEQVVALLGSRVPQASRG